VSDVPQGDGWWQASDGRWYPPDTPINPQTHHPPPVQPYVLTIGDAGLTPTHVVTPNGTAPLRGSQWIVRDMTVTSSTTPTYAVVLAVFFALACLLGLLFLLIKEQKTSGYVEVSVTSGPLYHVTQLPVSNPYQVMAIRQLVAQAQAMAAAAPAVD
jgi:hypothetical protein